MTAAKVETGNFASALARRVARRIKRIARDRRRPTPQHSPVFVLGHQKSGTSAVAGLLAAISGSSVSIDLRREIEDLLIPEIVRGAATIEELVRRNRADFAAGIVKHPNLTLVARELFDSFPASPAVFVIRDPRDNIRSILDRLLIDGTTTDLSNDQWQAIPRAWQLVLGLDRSGSRPNHLDALCDRWLLMGGQYLDHRDRMELIRYEDFVADKRGAIEALARSLDLRTDGDIDSLLDHQFQPRGSHRGLAFGDFFGENNLDRIERRCGTMMAEFGYLVTR